jgi:hypothetical protein
MSALGVKRTSRRRAAMSAFDPKRTLHPADVLQCLLLTQSGHGRLKIAAVQLDLEPHFVDRNSLL